MPLPSSLGWLHLSLIGKSSPGSQDIGGILSIATTRCPGLCKLGVMTTPVMHTLDFFNPVISHTSAKFDACFRLLIL